VPLPPSASAASRASWRRLPWSPACPWPDAGWRKGSLSEGERQRLAALAAGTANWLLVMFVMAVALPLLPAKLADLFWLFASTGASTGTEILRHGGL